MLMLCSEERLKGTFIPFISIMCNFPVWELQRTGESDTSAQIKENRNHTHSHIPSCRCHHHIIIYLSHWLMKHPFKNNHLTNLNLIPFKVKLIPFNEHTNTIWNQIGWVESRHSAVQFESQSGNNDSVMLMGNFFIYSTSFSASVVWWGLIDPPALHSHHNNTTIKSKYKFF